MNRWEDAAFEQEHLLHHIDGYFGELLDGYQEEAFGIHAGEARVLRGVHKSMLEHAEPMYVADGPMTLWEHARETFRPEAVERTDLVSPAGFALLPRATFISDRHGRQVGFRAIAWMPISNRNTQTWDEGVESQGVWVSLLSYSADHDEYMEDDLVTAAHENGWRWSLMHGTAIGFGERVWDNVAEDDPDRAKIVSLFAYVQSFWRLMAQLVPVQTSLPRQWRRDRVRKQLVKDVVVIHLRRVREGADGPEATDGHTIDYSHQWVVRGHWRKQPYGPRHDVQYRQIWISPYVKGPEDKPLIVKKRVFEWDR